MRVRPRARIRTPFWRKSNKYTLRDSDVKRCADRFEQTYLIKVTWESCAGLGCWAANSLQIFSCGAKDELGKGWVFDIRHLINYVWGCVDEMHVYCACCWRGPSSANLAELGIMWMFRLQEPGKLLWNNSVQPSRILKPNFDPVLSAINALTQFWPKWLWTSSNGCGNVLQCVWPSYANWDWLLASHARRSQGYSWYLLLCKQHCSVHK